MANQTTMVGYHSSHAPQFNNKLQGYPPSPRFPLEVENYRYKIKEAEVRPESWGYLDLSIFTTLPTIVSILIHWGKVERTCHSKKSLSRLTPLVRTRMSSGGLQPNDVISWASMSFSVICLSGLVAWWGGRNILDEREMDARVWGVSVSDTWFNGGCYFVAWCIRHAEIEDSAVYYDSELAEWSEGEMYRVLCRVIDSAFWTASWTFSGRRLVLPRTLSRTPYSSRMSL